MILRRALLVLLIAFPSGFAGAKEDPAERAYQAARKHYYALKDDAARRKFRHHWLNAAAGFEAVAERHPRSDRAPDALFTAAELQNELSRISRLDEDLASAIRNYRRLCDDYRQSSLLDDAALALARIYADRLGKDAQAREVLADAAEHGKGDRASELAALWRSLDPKAPALRFGPRPKHRAVAKKRRTAPEPAPVAAAKQEAPGARPTTRDAVAARSDAPAGGATAAPSAEVKADEARSAAELNRDALAKAFERAAQLAPALSARSTEVTGTAKLPPAVGALRAAAEPGERRAGPQVATAAAVATASEPARSLPEPDRAGLTLAEQLGLKVRRVVIDPGHGGRDSGAVRGKKLMEKDVALAVSLQVAKRLRAEGLEVLLTREDDRFIALEERARFANEARGDLFISIHCNSAPTRKLRGIETYTLNTSADRYSIRLAARENASSEKGISDLQFILADLATKANTGESARLATRVQKSLVTHLSKKYSGIKDLGTKEALFYVLLGAKMPAILVETSFLSHPQEGARLGTRAYQQDLAEAISGGVLDFLEHRGHLAQVR